MVKGTGNRAVLPLQRDPVVSAELVNSHAVEEPGRHTDVADVVVVLVVKVNHHLVHDAISDCHHEEHFRHDRQPGADVLAREPQ